MRWATIAVIVFAYTLAWSSQLFSAGSVSPQASPAATMPAQSESPAAVAPPSSAPTTQAAGMPAAAATSRPVLTVESAFQGSGKDPGPMVEPREGGYVDWGTCQVVAVGTGAARSRNANDVAMAGRAARLVAARNAVLILHGIQAGPRDQFPGFQAGQITVDGLMEHFTELSSDFDPAKMTATVKLAWDLPRDACQRQGFIFLTHHKDPAVRVIAVRALGQMGGHGATEALKAAQTDPDPSVRQAAQTSLRQLHAPD